MPTMDRMLDATAAAEDRHFWFKGLRRNANLLLARGLAGRAPQLIVDCGSGTGRNLDWLSTFGPAVGVELSTTGLEHGRRRGRRLVRASVTALPFANGSADAATSFDVLYCLDDDAEREAVREMWRILRPGGVAVVNVAALDVLKGSHSALTQEQRRYTKKMLAARLGAVGFTIEKMTFANMSPFPFALAIRLFERATGRAGTPSTNDLAVPAAPVNAVFDALLTAEAAWLRLGNLPIGSSLLALVRKPT
jgi:SAM-dependent methyltransferase